MPDGKGNSMTTRRQVEASPCGPRNEELPAHAGDHGPEFRDAVCARLDDLAGLPANWDSYGAPVIDRNILEAARRFIRSLPENLAPCPLVVPMSGGNLQLEWHRGSKILELEFEDTATIRYLQWHPEPGVEEEDSFPATDINRAVELLQW